MCLTQMVSNSTFNFDENTKYYNNSPVGTVYYTMVSCACVYVCVCAFICARAPHLRW